MNDYSMNQAADDESNETIYRKILSSFVDDIIARWTPLSDPEDGARDRTRQTAVCLRDLMQLEEVLVKLEREDLRGREGGDMKEDPWVMQAAHKGIPGCQTTRASDEVAPRERQRKPLATVTVPHLSSENRSTTAANSTWVTFPTRQAKVVDDKLNLVTNIKTAKGGDEVQVDDEAGPSLEASDRRLPVPIKESHRGPSMAEKHGVFDGTSIESPSALSGVVVTSRPNGPRNDCTSIPSRSLGVTPLHGPQGSVHEPRIDLNNVQVSGGNLISRDKTDTRRTNMVASMLHVDSIAARSGLEERDHKRRVLIANGDSAGFGSSIIDGRFGNASDSSETSVEASRTISQQSLHLDVPEESHLGNRMSRKGGSAAIREAAGGVTAIHGASPRTSVTHRVLQLSPSRTLGDNGSYSSLKISPRAHAHRDISLASEGGAGTGVRMSPSGHLPSAVKIEICSDTSQGGYGIAEQAESPGGPPSPSVTSVETPMETPKEGRLDTTMLENTRIDTCGLDTSDGACAEQMQNQSSNMDHIVGDLEADSCKWPSVGECTSPEMAQKTWTSSSNVVSDDEAPQGMLSTHDEREGPMSADCDTTYIDPGIDRNRVSDVVGHSLHEAGSPCIVGFAGSPVPEHDSETQAESQMILDGHSHGNEACGSVDENSTESPEIIRSSSGYEASEGAAVDDGTTAKFSFTEGVVAQVDPRRDFRIDEGVGIGDECHSPLARRVAEGLSLANETLGSDTLSPGILGFDFDGKEAPSPIALSDLEDQGSYTDNLRSPGRDDSLSRTGSDFPLAAVVSPPRAALPGSGRTMPSRCQVSEIRKIAIGGDDGNTQYPGASSQECAGDGARLAGAGPLQEPESVPDGPGYSLPRCPKGPTPPASQHNVKLCQTAPQLETCAGECELPERERVWVDTGGGNREEDSGASLKAPPAIECPNHASAEATMSTTNDGETSCGKTTRFLSRQASCCPVVESPAASGGKRDVVESGRRGSERSSILSSSGRARETSDTNDGISSLHEHDDLDERWGDVGDISLLEGTPRRGDVNGSGTGDLSGFYAPLSMAYCTKIRRDDTLSEEQSITLRWMLWREGRISRDGAAGDATVGVCHDMEMIGNGGILGHLPWHDAIECLIALMQDESDGNTGERSRPGQLEASTGLPKGTTLVVSPSKEAAREWSDRAAACGAGLSVLEYVMPLRERRRLSARQIAAFDVVVTTYDVFLPCIGSEGVSKNYYDRPLETVNHDEEVLRAKEVPTTGVVQTLTIKSNDCNKCNSRIKGEWLGRRDTKGTFETRCRHVQTRMNSLLHHVWWHRVVADGADILATRRSTRAEALFGLTGRARWCVVARESMGFVESASDRMRSLTRFLRIPPETPLVEAAPSLFFANRPPDIAPKIDGKGALSPPPDSHSRAQTHVLDREARNLRDSSVGSHAKGVTCHGSGTQRDPRFPTRNMKGGPPALAAPGEASAIRVEGLSGSGAQDARLGSKPTNFQRRKVVYNQTQLNFKRVQIEGRQVDR